MTTRKLIGCGILSIGLFAGLGTLFVGGLFALTQPVVDASEHFLALLGQGKIAEAYASAADGLHTQQDEASFALAVQQLGLTDYSSAVWRNRQIENQEGMAEGIVTTKSGHAQPVSIRLVKEGGKWAVVGVRFAGIDIVTIKAPPAVPTEVELERLVAETLLSFDGAIGSRNFTAFCDKLSEVWRKETTPLLVAGR